jgi:hypothetical protein
MDPDFYYFLRCKDFSPDDFSDDDLQRLKLDWERSKKKGKFERIYQRKRRQEFGPGKFHAATSTGVFLNKNFVKGWRGINPKLP